MTRRFSEICPSPSAWSTRGTRRTSRKSKTGRTFFKLRWHDANMDIWHIQYNLVRVCSPHCLQNIYSHCAICVSHLECFEQCFHNTFFFFFFLQNKTIFLKFGQSTIAICRRFLLNGVMCISQKSAQIWLWGGWGCKKFNILLFFKVERMVVIFSLQS